jgi:hypothetical protein
MTPLSGAGARERIVNDLAALIDNVANRHSMNDPLQIIEVERQLGPIVDGLLAHQVGVLSSDERTVKSIATMLGWENVPPQHVLEAEIRALKARASGAPRQPSEEALEAAVAVYDNEKNEYPPEDMSPMREALKAAYAIDFPPGAARQGEGEVERERCAKLCEAWSEHERNAPPDFRADGWTILKQVAAAIRARPSKGEG